ncbi:MAG TPA: hypothetical protein DD490_16780 [Acidobacteria bacterium]|nr:hypothetical protein [Acidobacteriota bacterium]
MTQEADSSDLIFNGIDGASGTPYYPSLTADEVATLALGRPPDAQAVARARRRTAAERPHLGLRDGYDPRLLADGGWGVIFARDADPVFQEALAPLVAHRQLQATARDERRFRVFAGADGVRPGEGPDDFLARHHMSLDAADPNVVPYNLLLVGNPEEISWDFQSGLDLQYAVGRIAFETADETGRYAGAVIAGETGTAVPAGPRKAAFFGVRNPGDRPTLLAAEHLLGRVAATVEAGQPAWSVERIVGEGATKARLTHLLGGGETPAFLFTTSHGMGFPKDDPRQPPHQGALLCQDWSGSGPISEDHYLAGDHLAVDARPGGLIAFFFACHGAGTPRHNLFPERGGEARELAGRPFAARLPHRLLAQGALAVVGHVERTWGYSFLWEGAGAQTAPFEDSVKRLLDGWPVGAALETFVLRRAFLTDQLHAAIKRIDSGEPVDAKKLTRLWTAHSDSRAFVLLGDPAVRLP